jgi:hypothetical protein
LLTHSKQIRTLCALSLRSMTSCRLSTTVHL